MRPVVRIAVPAAEADPITIKISGIIVRLGHSLNSSYNVYLYDSGAI